MLESMTSMESSNYMESAMSFEQEFQEDIFRRENEEKILENKIERREIEKEKLEKQANFIQKSFKEQVDLWEDANLFEKYDFWAEMERMKGKERDFIKADTLSNLDLNSFNKQ